MTALCRGASVGACRAWAGEAGREGDRGPWLRSLAAIGFLAAGAIHLAQVVLHLTEGLVFAGFFLVVGGLQVVAAAALVRARRPRWYWLGLAGSAAVIATWFLSRTFGLPFGAEPGSPEAIGTADAAAFVFEAVTIVAMLLWLAPESAGRSIGRYAAAAVAVAALGVLWVGARMSGLFEPDPRLTGFPPDFADRVVVVFVAAVVAVIAALMPEPTARTRGLVRGSVVVAGVAAVVLSVLVLPARGGQNLDCRYGPVAEVSGLTHAEPPEPVEVELQDVGDVAVLRLSVCGRDPVMLTDTAPLKADRPGDWLVGFGIRDYVQRIPIGIERDDVGGLDPPMALLLDAPPAVLLRPGETVEVVARIRGIVPGRYRLDSVRLALRGRSGEATMAFATYLYVCVAVCRGTDD